MNSFASFTPLTKLAYQTLQNSKSIFGLAHATITTRLTEFAILEWKKKIKPLSAETILKLQNIQSQLLETDWLDAEMGVYDADLLFENPWEDFWRYYPLMWLDLPNTWQLIQKKQYQKFSSTIEQDGYPSYYLQNFHHQTDGYLSEMSANLYDLQVDILFKGVADAMRRRILKPLKTKLSSLTSDIAPQQVRVLDVACGTGRTLKMIRAILPKASLFGLDLSPNYLKKANQILSETPGELPQLIQGNGEDLPYKNDYFHGITSVFLFHELPPEVRQRVIEECFRVTQPGGVFIICDSLQKLDSKELATVMDNFPKMFHEPYFQHYVNDNLVERLEKAGFIDIKIENHGFSKYWIAQKPNTNG